MDFLRRKQSVSSKTSNPKMSSLVNSDSPSPSPSPSAISSKNTLSKIADVPVHCDPQTSVLSAALLMKEKRTHCLLIIDEISGKLIGLTTTKDLAFRAVAKNMDLNTPISTIMTKNPYYVSQITTPNEALKLMVNKKIRHLPIVNENELVIGILNITTCFYNAMIRLERMSEKSKELECTFNDLNNNLNSSKSSPSHILNISNNNSVVSTSRPSIPSITIKDQSHNLIKGNYSSQLDLLALNEGLLDLNISRRKKKIINDLRSLISIMKQPDLKSLLNDNDLNARKPFYIDAKTSIWDASQLLLENNLTAALIVQNNNDIDFVENIIGIFTTKDLVYRVLACKIDSKVSKVARVMTSKPEFANDSMAIHNALRLMYEGKYLNLPIKNSENEVTGLVNVLDLTYALLKTLSNSSLNDYAENYDIGMGSLTSSNDHSSKSTENNAPAWNKFWDSLDRPLNQVSSSTKPSYSSIDRKILSQRSASFVSIASEPTKPVSPVNTYVEIKIDDDSKIISSSKELDLRSVSSINNELAQEKILLKVKIREDHHLNLGLNDKIYRFDYLNDDNYVTTILDSIISKIKQRILGKNFSELKFHLGYLDDDQDFITIDSIDDLKVALEHNQKRHLNLTLNITKEIKDIANHRSNHRSSLNNDDDQNNSHKTSTYLLLGGLGIFILIFSRMIFIGKRYHRL